MTVVQFLPGLRAATWPRGLIDDYILDLMDECEVSLFFQRPCLVCFPPCTFPSATKDKKCNVFCKVGLNISINVTC